MVKNYLNTNILLFQSQFYFPWQEFFIHLVSQIVINPKHYYLFQRRALIQRWEVLQQILPLPGDSLLNSSVNANAEEAYEIFRSTNFLTIFIEKYSLDKYIIAGESVESGKVIFNENYNLKQILEKWL